MTNAKLYTTGFDNGDLRTRIDRSVIKTATKCLSAAYAYTSIYGANFLRELCKKRAISSVSLITDVRDRITHPTALRLGLDEGWSIRVVNRSQGTFHPKIIVGSMNVADNLPVDPRMVIVGSGNLSRGGLHGNVECGFERTSNASIEASAVIYSRLWELGIDLTEGLLSEYEVAFRERNEQRSAADLSALGVSDEPDPLNVALARTVKAPKLSSMRPAIARAAWAGLESFTGEYTFQLEFPKDAGSVLRRIITQTGQSPFVSVLCDDGIIRPMRYRYYEHNGMFRLNIPNDVPGITQARDQHAGIAIMEAISGGEAAMKISVKANADQIQEIEAKSFALGTWGKTSTRLYGWY